MLHLAGIGDRNDFADDQLATMLRLHGEKHKVKLQLAYFADGMDAVKLPWQGVADERDTYIVWIHNVQRHGRGGTNHWSGLATKSGVPQHGTNIQRKRQLDSGDVLIVPAEPHNSLGDRTRSIRSPGRSSASTKKTTSEPNSRLPRKRLVSETPHSHLERFLSIQALINARWRCTTQGHLCNGCRKWLYQGVLEAYIRR